MITKIEIYNSYSIKQCIINFEKAKYKYLEQMVFDDKLVNPVAFYGHNGSGKSSFFKTISDLVRMMIADPDNLYGFILNEVMLQKYYDEVSKLRQHKSIKEIQSSEELMYLIDSYIKLFLIIDGKKYTYMLKTRLRWGIIEENLEVDGEYIIKNKVESQPNVPSYFPALRKKALITPDKDMIIAKVYRYISNIASISSDRDYYQLKLLQQNSLNEFLYDNSDKIKETLSKYSEFPVYEIHRDDDFNNNSKRSFNYTFILKIKDSSIKLPIHFMSTGMYNQGVFLSILLNLPENSVMFIDEIEQALHPSTIMSFIEVARSRRIQLIFSSHNTHILQKLRPDQIFFANWKDGFSSYKKLSEIYPNIREVNNIERMYLSTMFDEEISNIE